MQFQEDKSKYKKQKMTLLLDGETIQIIKSYGKRTLGSDSVSASVRAMARDYARREQQQDL